MVAIELAVQAPHRLTVACGYLAVAMEDVVAYVDGLIQHLPGLRHQRLELFKCCLIGPPAVAFIQPVGQQRRAGQMFIFAGEELATGYQVALAQRADDPVVIDSFPAGFAHRAVDAGVATAPQQTPL